ncbi:hypothetical protein GCM10017784_00400 [Deinococcus indicus]|nr:hypothetical protein GCM10017784_00400 [Deinococcus indicus]
MVTLLTLYGTGPVGAGPRPRLQWRYPRAGRQAEADETRPEFGPGGSCAQVRRVIRTAVCFANNPEPVKGPYRTFNRSPDQKVRVTT